MQRAFWKEAVVYQIYPRSFMDSNGDGIGDLQGIVSRLDYLQELGVDVVWLSPVYQSPNDDNGYDISDYQAILGEFGTMEDWERLLEGLHARGIKLIMDLVVNHTSDEHPWFVSSRESKDSPYRDYYWWRPGRDGREPTNWVSVFSGPAWEYDEATGEYYMHLFSKKQPDLNWENEKVREEVYEMMTWWLDKGIDGFRMDVINMISKEPSLPDAGDARYAWGGEYFTNGPRIHEFLQEMNRRVLSRYDIMTVGETPGITAEEAVLYTGEDRGELNMVFQFEHMDVDSEGSKWNVKPWKLTDLKRILNKWQLELQGRGWNSLYLNNHDQPRMVSRFGNDGPYRVESAKMLATLLHTMQGTPYIYQGEEIGMTNVRFGSVEEYKDIETLNWYKERMAEGADPAELLRAVHAKGRDNARTPFQWDASPNGGFTAGTPWLAVNPNYHEINAEEARRNPDSIFHYYKKLIALRKQHDIMVYGEFISILDEHEQIYAYLRKLGEERWLILLNFAGESAVFELPGSVEGGGGELIIGNYGDAESQAASVRRVDLRPYEARVYRLV
ncbi:alpha-glucosidase [Paenibacillus mucilaginosus]|uniref:glycoside hydrolase family 13 protein n=1 Tax=Paenibacillus mucilaginosus TaxID=61624 RepID=UPI00240E3001|nr:alpha-glucosidase [Paenibacillus mucilaginosus]WFA20008.1 alpha-glucosidase [Paenibacillus mucilaginosus]